MNTLIYLHGLASSGQSSTSKALRELLPDWEIISPDIPVHPQEALPMLRQLCKEKKPKFVIGTSMGAMYAQQMHGYCKILVNPAFHVSKTLRKKMGICPFFSPRQDGKSEFEITPALCDAFEEMEKHQFDDINPIDIGITMAFFGSNDDQVDCRDEYFKRYAYGMMFEGGHRMSREILENCVIKWMHCNTCFFGTAKLDQIHYTKSGSYEKYQQEDVLKICMENGKYGLTGEDNCIYDDLFLIPETDLYACRLGMKWGILKYYYDKLITLVPCEMDVIFQCSEDEARLVVLLKDFKWGFAEAYLAKTYIPPIYEDLEWPCEEPIKVMKDGVWGYLGYDYNFTTDIKRAGFITYVIKDDW